MRPTDRSLGALVMLPRLHPMPPVGPPPLLKPLPALLLLLHLRRRPEA